METDDRSPMMEQVRLMQDQNNILPRNPRNPRPRNPRHFRMACGHLFKAAMVAMAISWFAASAGAQSTPGPLFAANTRHVAVVEEGPDANASKIDAAARRVDTQPLAIKGGSRYELSLQARLDSTFVVELNDRAHQLVLDSHRYRRTSTYLPIFLDKDGKEVTSFGTGGRGFFLTRQWQRYVMAFYTPEKAVAMKIRFEPANRDTFVREVSITELDDEPTVNLNPDFRYGELNYSGWNAVREGRLYTRPDGVVVLQPGYGGTSGIFPLDTTATYSVTAKGVGGRINMVYYDENGKQLHIRFLIRPSEKGEKPVEFTPPEGTRYGKLLTYQINSLESCHVVKKSGGAQ